MAESNEPWRREEEEEEEELDDTNYIAQKDAVLFAIDVSESMLALPPPSDDKKAEKDSPARAAIKCAYQIMQQRIISSPKDMMGVLLFGTEKTKFQDEDENSRGGLQYPHCYLLCDLDVPDAKDILRLKSIVEEDDSNEETNDLLTPTKEPVSMSNMLFCANQIFTTKAPNFGSRRLFIITDKDDPHALDKTARSQAAVRAKDLYDLGVIIELFPISHPEHDFDRAKFYDDIIYRDPAEGEDLAVAQSHFKSSGGGISLLNTLISDINSKQVAKRALFSNMPLELGPNLRISVKGYNLLQPQKPARSGYVWVDGEDQEPQFVVGQSSKIAADTAQEVAKDALRKAYKFGGSQILFTPDEQKKLKDFGPPVIRIIGFKPQSTLPFWASVKKATFIYPNEEHYIGSTRVFSALWQKLVKDKKMGLAWFIARANAVPALVAILPSEERVDDTTKVPVIPAGLWLCQLPFMDDIRPVGTVVAPPLVAPDVLTDEMRKVLKEFQRTDVLDDEKDADKERKVVQQLQLPKAIYDPNKYPNPALQWHYKILQTMALNDEIPDKAEDKTVPKFKQIDKRAGEYIQTWGEILDKEVRAYQKREYGGVDGTALKRSREDSEDTVGSKKKVKTTQSLSDLNTKELKTLVGTTGLTKYTVPELKEFLTVKGLDKVGKKIELMERIEQWVEDN